MFAVAQTQGMGQSSIHAWSKRPPLAWSAGQPDEHLPMTAHQGLKAFSHVVLAMLLAGIAYASTIAIIYWTGISV